MAYAAETRPETSEIQQMMPTVQMKLFTSDTSQKKIQSYARITKFPINRHITISSPKIASYPSNLLMLDYSNPRRITYNVMEEHLKREIPDSKITRQRRRRARIFGPKKREKNLSHEDAP
ncbi:hypothetical protein Trydic_g13018 [Trypoxylus dichotomus]